MGEVQRHCALQQEEGEAGGGGFGLDSIGIFFWIVSAGVVVSGGLLLMEKAAHNKLTREKNSAVQ